MKQEELAAEPKTLQISSTAFMAGEMIPAKYTCDGVNINPPLEVKGLPEGTQSLALIVDDPDAPVGTWVHWVVWNIPVAGHIAENKAPGTEGMNNFKKHQYGGPCPPSGTHRYFFKVYAMDALLELPESSTKADLINAMEGHVIGYGELIGKYKRN